MKKILMFFLLAYSAQTFATPDESSVSTCKRILNSRLGMVLLSGGLGVLASTGVGHLRREYNAQKHKDQVERLIKEYEGSLNGNVDGYQNYWTIVDQTLDGALEQRKQITPDASQGDNPTCMTCAFANSISYLNQSYHLGKPLDPMDIVKEYDDDLKDLNPRQLQQVLNLELSKDFILDPVPVSKDGSRLEKLRESIAAGSGGVVVVRPLPTEKEKDPSAHALTVLNIQLPMENHLRMLVYDSQDDGPKRPITLDAEYDPSAKKFRITSGVHKDWLFELVYAIEHVDFVAQRDLPAMIEKLSTRVNESYKARLESLRLSPRLKGEKDVRDFAYRDVESLLKDKVAFSEVEIWLLQPSYRIAKKLPTQKLLSIMEKDLRAPFAFELVHLLKEVAANGDPLAKKALKEIETYTDDPIAIRYARMP